MPLFGKKTPPPLWSSFPSSGRNRRRRESSQEIQTAGDTAMGNSHSRALGLKNNLFSVGRRPSSKRTLWDPPPYDSEDYTTPTTSNVDSESESPYAFLKDFDTIFLVDDSSSMKGDRWKEAEEAIAAIAPICTKYDDDGIDIYFLNHRPKIEDQDEKRPRQFYSNVKTAEDVQRIFENVQPRGSTPMGTRLCNILVPYLEQLQEASFRDTVGIFGESRPDVEPVKPINIIAITDGLFTDDAEGPIRDAVRRLDAPRMRVFPWQVGIQFFQIGNDERVGEYLQKLDDNLGRDERLRDIVDTVPWRKRKGKTLDANGILKAVLGAVDKRYDGWRVD